MGCNCRKKRKAKELIKEKEQERDKLLSIRKSWSDLNKQVRRQLTLIQSFGLSMASRGVTSKKTDGPTKQLRVLSCFGNLDVGGELIKCPHLKESKTPGKHYCGECGCGDRKGTHLVSQGEKYSKLDYPILSCPLKMPGFTNYEPSADNEKLPPMSRKAYIDTQLKPADIQRIKITIPDEDEESIIEIQEHLKD
tara:strand:- start:19342 stop:19923 length:582 start_codon:yes stop_codon:yes gene_type:complete